jgi:hypothetical protein
MKRIERAEDLGPALEELGDRRSLRPGALHPRRRFPRRRDRVAKSVVFPVHAPMRHPPFQVAHGGGIFTTIAVPKHDPAWYPRADQRDVLG